MTVNRLDLLFSDVNHPDCVITRGEIDVFVFTDCNGGVQHATKINNFARLTFHERFQECISEGRVDPERFREIFPNETLPEDSLEGFHFFDWSALHHWIYEEQKRTCPICVRIMDELLVCPYLTEKFNQRREELLQETPQIVKLKGEAKQRLKFRGLIGLVVASVTLFYLFRSIYRYFKEPTATT